MKEKRRVIIITILFLLIGIFVVFRITREKNVFDEMYYSRVHRYYDWFGNWGINPREMFSNMEQMEGVGRDSELIYTEEQWFVENYAPEYLNENERLSISMRMDEKIMYISFYHDVEDEGQQWYTYCYYVDEKLLLYETNDPEDKEGRKDFLYEIFLRDWFAANEGISDYSMDDLGEFEFVDETETSEAE